MFFDLGNPDIPGVEIQTLEISGEEGDEEYLKVSNAEDFALLVKQMGFKDTKDFEEDTGIFATELIGKFWMTMGDHFIGHNRVYMKEDE